MIPLSRLLVLYIAVLSPIAFAADLPEYCAQLDDAERVLWHKLSLAMIEGLPAAHRMRPAIATYYQAEGKWPENNADAGLPAPDQYRGKLLQSITALPDGRIELVFNAQSGVDGGRVLFVPTGGALGRWRCETPDYPLIKCAVSTCDYNPTPVVTPSDIQQVALRAEALFDFGKATLRQEGKDLLNAEVVEKMKAHPEIKLMRITGYTDRIGSDSYNQKLSERRANSVKRYVVSQGIEESRLYAIGKGEIEPVVDCKGVYGKKAIKCLQPNRRVVAEVEVQ
jgi:outer membrane protein OmpA-like peptidoglycan-associated protein